MEALNCCKKKEPPSPTDSESLGEYFAVGDTGTVEMDTLTGGSINRPNGGNRKKKAKRKADRLPSLLPIKDYESLDYDTCNNVPHKHWLESYGKFTYWHMSLMRWVLVALIGICTGSIAFLIDVGIFYLKKLKFLQFFAVYNLTKLHGTVYLGLLVLIGFNGLYSIIAAILVAIEPIAAGSGIPEIKCYLNGIKMPRVARLRALVAKAVGVLFSVAGGFLVGKEGPMIHSGAIVGAGIPQLRTFIWEKLKLPYPYFRSDKDKRDFVSCGAAAGVAAAFGAPIGGVLFSLEEGSSFWDQGLTWRSLFCAMCSTITLNLFLSGTPLVPHTQFGELDRPGLIDFGRFSNGGVDNNLWSFPFLFIFIIIGAGGGLLGAWFNSLNERLTIYRMKHVFRKNIIFKILEVVLIGAFTSFAVFNLATWLGTCVPRVPSNNPSVNISNTGRNYFCPPDGLRNLETGFTSYYNDFATLVFNSQEDAIKQLFHQDGAFTLPTLGIIFFTYFFIACWTYGAGIPSGLFVPCLTIGALYGRFIITVFWTLGWEPNIDAGTFALIGAAAFLGGVVRMTVSLTVILIESTDEIEYGLPLLVTLMVAKWVGDLFNEGLYDIHIEVKEIPLLGWDSPEKMNRLSAADVMNKDLKYIYPVSRVGSIERLLKVTAHNAFFVVSPLNVPKSPTHGGASDVLMDLSHSPQLYRRYSINPKLLKNVKQQRKLKDDSYNPESSSASYNPDNGNHETQHVPLVFHGIILRSQLVELLRNRIFFSENLGVSSQPTITHLEMTKDYPRYKSIYDVTLTEDDKQMLMDVSLYMNPCPYTISHHAPLARTFNLFRTMGLRHLPVLEDSGIVVGMITRHDLTHEHLHKVAHDKEHLRSVDDSVFNRSNTAEVNVNPQSENSTINEIDDV